jgi:hypothetical protein
MLGQKLGQESGRVTSRRVLKADGPPCVEISFAAEGTILGVKHRSIGTYESVVRADGMMFGSGQGVAMGGGGEMGSWKGQGLGTFTKDGGVEFRGVIFFSTASPAWQQLNKVVAVFEYSEKADGTTQLEAWEWR